MFIVINYIKYSLKNMRAIIIILLISIATFFFYLKCIKKNPEAYIKINLIDDFFSLYLDKTKIIENEKKRKIFNYKCLLLQKKRNNEMKINLFYSFLC